MATTPRPMIQLIGTNPRVEAPVLNARIRKAWAAGANVGLIGQAVDLTYDYKHMGTDRAALVKAVEGAEAFGKPAVVIVGQGALNEADGEAVVAGRAARIRAIRTASPASPRIRCVVGRCAAIRWIPTACRRPRVTTTSIARWPRSATS